MNQLLLAHLDPPVCRSSPVPKTAGRDAPLPVFSPICTITAWSGSKTPLLILSALRRWTRPVARLSTHALLIARAQRDAWKCSRKLSRTAFLDVSSSSHGAAGRPHGPPEQPCSGICSRTRPIIVARPSCSPANWAVRYRTRPPTASGAGRNSGRSVDLTPARDETSAPSIPAARNSRLSAQQRYFYFQAALTGWPTRSAEFAPGRGRNFSALPLFTSARYKLPSWSTLIPCTFHIAPGQSPILPQE
jgi:hypothetical protein